MKAAVEIGDAKKVAELIRHDPGFKVNAAVDGEGFFFLCLFEWIHFLCS